MSDTPKKDYDVTEITLEKFNEMRHAINRQGRRIKALEKEQRMMKLVLDYDRKLKNLESFFSTLEEQGVDINEAMKNNPEITAKVMSMVRNM